MPEITNNTTDTLDFVVSGKAKDGVPPTESVGPGETKSVDAIDSARFRGYLASGAISVKGSRAAAKADAPSPTTRAASK
jgi:hypothetical protein